MNTDPTETTPPTLLKVVITGMPGLDYEKVVALLDSLGHAAQIATGDAMTHALITNPRNGIQYVVADPSLDTEVGSLPPPSGDDFSIIYLDASDEVLAVNRSKAGDESSFDAFHSVVRAQRDETQRLRKYATAVIDISSLSDAALRQRLHDAVLLAGLGTTVRPRIDILSFGFKYGLPTDLNLVFDGRILPNPFWVEGLREGTGKDKQVFDYVMSSDATGRFLSAIVEWLEWSWPMYVSRQQLIIQVGIGCTGGQHRSVAVTIALQEELKRRGFTTTLLHRDLENVSREDENPPLQIPNL